MNNPNYKRIYQDMIRLKYPEKEILCNPILSKNSIDNLDIIKLNNIITGKTDKIMIKENQKLKSYDRATIMKILNHQKKNNVSNTELAIHFKMSRNTIARWKKLLHSDKL